MAATDPITLTGDERSALDAAVGGLRAMGVFYAADTAPADPADPKAGTVGQDHGVLEAYADAPDGALAKAATDLASLRAGTLQPPVIVPQNVHAYQFAGQAADEGIITADEGKAWAGAGTVPASLQAAVDKIVTDPKAHDQVTFFLVGATDFPRYNANTVALGALFGKDTPDKLDAFFIAAGAR